MMTEFTTSRRNVHGTRRSTDVRSQPKHNLSSTIVHAAVIWIHGRMTTSDRDFCRRKKLTDTQTHTHTHGLRKSNCSYGTAQRWQKSVLCDRRDVDCVVHVYQPSVVCTMVIFASGANCYVNKTSKAKC